MKFAAAPLAILFLILVVCALSAKAQNDDAPASAPGSTASSEKDAVLDSSESENSSPKTFAEVDKDAQVRKSILILVIGIATVLGLIIVLKVNAFIALITAALAVSFLAVGLLGEGSWPGAVGRVASAFGDTVTNIGIVIALAAVIGKCLLDSGAADRIVRAFLRLLGVKGSPVALMGSGFVLAVPVFFDTVFYLLVPLARSLHRQTKKNYLMYIMAIGAGGAITHTLVPPTPGPLMMASNLGFEIGEMIIVGGIVALPAAFVGLVFAKFADRLMKVPMREVAGQREPDPLKDEELPSLWLALLPIVLPVLLIATNTVLTTIADNQHAAALKVDDIKDWPAFRTRIRSEAAEENATPGKRVVQTLQESRGLKDKPARENVLALLRQDAELTPQQRETVVTGLNEYVLADKRFHRGEEETAFLGFLPSKTARSLLKEDRTRMKQAHVERMNRSLLESAYNGDPDKTADDLIAPHVWETPSRKAANVADVFGNPNLALLISTVIALALVVKQRKTSRRELADLVEHSLLSGGLIILITAGGGAFGAMLKTAQIGESIQHMFGSAEGGIGSGVMILVLSFLIGSLLKIAQGSGTVSMIVGTSMMAAIVAPIELDFAPVYIACAVGAGSLVCSWMNDSGFWIFAKMGGLTEGEALKSWTVMLVVLGLVSLGATVALAQIWPFPIS